MSIIAVEGIPVKWSLVQVIKSFAPIIAGKFEALNFVSGPGKLTKTCYLRVSERIDPLLVVEKLNSKSNMPKLNLRAHIPDEIPDIPLANARKIPQKLARALKIPAEDSPHKILIVTHMELLTELQSKFTSLYNLSRKTPSHSLLQNIARTLFERLLVIMKSNSDAASSCFKLSRAYRRLHPHFGDFQLILSTLHGLQDAKCVPRTQLTEEQLTVVNASPYSIDNIPYDRIQTATSKYSLKITKKVLEHIRNLEVGGEGGTEEDVARRKVRQELKNLAQHLPSIIRQVIQKHLTPEKTPYHRMRIYGEPFMPNKDQMSPFVRRFRAVKIVRSDRMFNLLKMNVPPELYANLIAQDGTTIGGAKLVIRSSDIPTYKVTGPLLKEMAATFGAQAEPADFDEDDDDMEADTPDW